MKKIKQLLMSVMIAGMMPLMSSCDKIFDTADNPSTPLPETVHINDVKLTAEGIVDGEVTVEVGTTLQLSAVVYPVDTKELAVSWTSSDKDVLTVSATGLVTAVKAGTVTVTVASAYNPAINAKVTIHVVDGQVNVNDTPVHQDQAQSRKK